MTPSDFIRGLGPLGLTLRLRRLSDRLLEDGRRIYTALEVPLEPSWYAPLLLLGEAGPLTVTQIADRLGQKHPTVVETMRKLERSGMIVARRDSKDRRSRSLGLTETARENWPSFQRCWEAFREELASLLSLGSIDFLQSLSVLEDALAESSLEERVLGRLEARSSSRESRDRKAQVPVDLSIRPTEEEDREGVLHIGRELVRSPDTYAFDPETSDDQLWQYWSPSGSGEGFVAVHKREIVGVFVIRPNHPGPGSHVANASYAVRADVRGLGLGRRMGEASLRIARDSGYRGMQFNIVISTNQTALRLWRSLGFHVIGTVPEGFRLPDGKLVAHHLLYRSL